MCAICHQALSFPARWCPFEHFRGLSTLPFLLLVRDLLPVGRASPSGKDRGGGLVSAGKGQRDRREGQGVQQMGPEQAGARCPAWTVCSVSSDRPHSAPSAGGSLCEGGPGCLFQNPSCDYERLGSWGNPPCSRVFLDPHLVVQLPHGELLLTGSLGAGCWAAC